MDETLYKLAAWYSPGYPVGAFAYSHGLENAVTEGQVRDAASTEAWIEDCLVHGAGRSDAILLAAAWRMGAEPEADRAGEGGAIGALALALAASAERRRETAEQGAAFASVTRAAWGAGDPAFSPPSGDPLPYPAAVGRAAAAEGLPLAPVLQTHLQAFAANLVSAAVRLVPLGQTEGQRILAKLMPRIGETAQEAEAAQLEEIGGIAILSDIASMRHETQTTRLFRS